MATQKEVLQHLGIKPGERIELAEQAPLKASQLKGSWWELRGILRGKTNGAQLSIEEIDAAITAAGALARAGSR
jgi:hypothetical protein